MAAEPAPVPPLSSYLAKRCPRRVQLDLVEPGVPLQPSADVQTRLDEGVAFWGIRPWLSCGQWPAQPWVMPITKMRRMPTPMYPSTRPAVAIPRPTCGPCEASIWRCARWPKITANTDPIQKSQRMPNHP